MAYDDYEDDMSTTADNGADADEDGTNRNPAKKNHAFLRTLRSLQQGFSNAMPMQGGINPASIPAVPGSSMPSPSSGGTSGSASSGGPGGLGSMGGQLGGVLGRLLARTGMMKADPSMTAGVDTSQIAMPDVFGGGGGGGDWSGVGAFAKGGYVTKPTFALLGETASPTNPEVVVPPKPAKLPPPPKIAKANVPALPRLPKLKPTSPSAPLRAGGTKSAIRPFNPRMANVLRGLQSSRI